MKDSKSIEKSQPNQDLQLIKDIVTSSAEKVSDAEFKLFMYLANEYQLDPMRKQIWIVKYGERPAQIYAGRDGFLAIAHRSPHFDGMDSTSKIVERSIDVGDLKRAFCYEATCIVHRKDMSHSFSVTVSEQEYSTGKNLWKTKPETMLKKVVESQCLRKAFDISGLYDENEAGVTVKDIEKEVVNEQLDVDADIAKIKEPHLKKIKSFLKSGQVDIDYVRELAKAKKFNGPAMVKYLEGLNEATGN